MAGSLKRIIQGELYKKCIAEYQRELHNQTDPYLLWVKEMEADKKVKYDKGKMPDIHTVFIENCKANFSLSKLSGKYIIFTSDKGVLSDNAKMEIKEYFDENKDSDIVYADEDVWADGVRCFPWTKPEWSPDTLISFLYFGNIFAIRKEAFLNIKWLGDKDYRKNIYDFVLKAVEGKAKIGHIEKFLFHLKTEDEDRKSAEKRLMEKTDFIGVGSRYDDIKINAFKRKNIDADMVIDEKTGISYPLYNVKNTPKISIVIPSKDNPNVLKQCVKSVYENTDYRNFEIIVVDNGSTGKTQEIVEAFRKEYDFKYIYKPMDFNFSKMCNIGIGESTGEYILLLNDDMEAIEPAWLRKMVGQASLPHTGAVGAKLLYPNTSKIQHVGVTNTVWGPGHKLKQFDDTVSYYYGRNRFVYNMIGVTAACLMIKKSILTEIGGLCEELAVAYNDVDLCFNIYERGLFNVQRNDVILYHHESLSRGDDMLDEKKIERLKKEQKLLYARHRKLYRHDPYIGTILNAGDPEYSCRSLNEYELVNTADAYSGLKQGKKLPRPENMNQMMFVEIDECGKDEFSKADIANGTQKIGYYVIKGWAYVHNLDNARYAYTLLFVNNEGKVWELPTRKYYRKDVAKILPHEKNVELTGFYNRILEGALPKGEYDVWITLKDRCSRQRLYKKSKKTLIIE